MYAGSQNQTTTKRSAEKPRCREAESSILEVWANDRCRAGLVGKGIIRLVSGLTSKKTVARPARLGDPKEWIEGRRAKGKWTDGSDNKREGLGSTSDISTINRTRSGRIDMVKGCKLTVMPTTLVLFWDHVQR